MAEERNNDRNSERSRAVEDRNNERTKAIELAFAQIEKQFGKGSIMRLGSKEAIVPIAVISTGAISFDAALGVGGVPRGRVVEIFGPESSGKTTIALQVIAEAQKAGGMAAFVDAEHALDPGYAKKLGVDVDNLLVSQPDYGEQALEITEALVRSNSIDVLVVDSVAALVPKAELDGEMGDSHMGLQARLMSQALRKLTGTVAKSRTCLIFINQIREKIGVMFGNPETTTGGRALKFYSSVRIDIRRIAAIKEGDVVTGLAHPRQSREEQGGGAVPRSRVRHSLWRRHLARRRPARYRREQQHSGEVGLVVQLQRRAHRPGTRERPRLPEGKQRHDGQARCRSAQSARTDSIHGGASSGSCSGAGHRYARARHDDAVSGGSVKSAGGQKVARLT